MVVESKSHSETAYSPGAHYGRKYSWECSHSSIGDARVVGVKLSYYLGAKQWDLVHLVYPTNIGVSVLPVCAWRRIPVYCSHHVDMEYYIDKYMHFELFAR